MEKQVQKMQFQFQFQFHPEIASNNEQQEMVTTRKKVMSKKKNSIWKGNVENVRWKYYDRKWQVWIQFGKEQKMDR